MEEVTMVTTLAVLTSAYSILFQESVTMCSPGLPAGPSLHTTNTHTHLSLSASTNDDRDHKEGAEGLVK